MASRARVAQARGAGRRRSPSRGEAHCRAIYIEVPEEDLVARVAGRCGLPDRAARRTTPSPIRRASPGICDRDGTPLVQRDDDRPEVVRARLRKQMPPMLDVVEHYDDAGVLRRVDGRQPIDAVTARDPRGARG